MEEERRNKDGGKEEAEGGIGKEEERRNKDGGRKKEGEAEGKELRDVNEE